MTTQRARPRRTPTRHSSARPSTQGGGRHAGPRAGQRRAFRLPRAGDAPDNLALACESCNLYKCDATTGWDEHFRFDSETGKLQGLTAVGRVTIIRLKMNSAFQVRARRHWAQLGLYP